MRTKRLPRLPAGWTVLADLTVPDAGLIEYEPNLLFADGWTLATIYCEKPPRANNRRGVDGIVQIRASLYRHCRIASTRGVRWTATFTRTVQDREYVSRLSNYRQVNLAPVAQPRCNSVGGRRAIWVP